MLRPGGASARQRRENSLAKEDMIQMQEQRRGA